MRSEKFIKIKEDADYDVKTFCLDSAIFYLSFGSDERESIKQKVSTIVIPQALNFSSVSLIDNDSASFVFDTIKYVERYGDSYLFDYSLSAQNMNDSNISYSGAILPHEYFSSPILYLRIVKSGVDFFCVSCNQPFTPAAFSRVLNLATDLTRNLTKNFLFIFRDYQEGLHRSEVSEVLSTLKGRAPNLNVHVDQLGLEFRSLINE